MKQLIAALAALTLAAACTEPEHARDRDPAEALQADATQPPFLPDAPSYQVREAIRSAALEVRPDRALFQAAPMEEAEAAAEEERRAGELIAAHRAFPFNVLLRLTREETGAQVEVRVVDGGPFAAAQVPTLEPNPVITVSPEAASRLGARPGQRVPVWVEVVQWAP